MDHQPLTCPHTSSLDLQLSLRSHYDNLSARPKTTRR